MRILLSARGWVALCAVLGSATAVAAPPAERPAALPNAADPKPDTSGPQGPSQAVVVSLEKRSNGAANTQLQSQKKPAPSNKNDGRPAPFNKPGTN